MITWEEPFLQVTGEGVDDRLTQHFQTAVHRLSFINQRETETAELVVCAVVVGQLIHQLIHQLTKQGLSLVFAHMDVLCLTGFRCDRER